MRFLYFLVVVLSLLFNRSLVNAEQDETSDPVLLALSTRHVIPIQKLEQLAGGKDQLISKLLIFRTKEAPPFVAVRSERILLKYADRENVLATLEQDIKTPGLDGLAKVIINNIDNVPATNARQRLARAVIDRATRDDESFKFYARSLKKSADPVVAGLASQLSE